MSLVAVKKRHLVWAAYISQRVRVVRTFRQQENLGQSDKISSFTSLPLRARSALQSRIKQKHIVAQEWQLERKRKSTTTVSGS